MVRMACCRLSLYRIHASWRDLHVLGGWNRPGLEAGRKIRHSCFSTRFHHGPLTFLSKRGFSMLPIFPKSDPSNTAEGLPLQYSLQNSSTSGKAVPCEGTDSSNLQKSEPSIDPMNNRVMLVDGTAIMYRSYYKLLAKLQHGLLEQADGNADWVLTIFTALSLLLDVLEFVPSHVAVIFDYDGVPYGHTTAMPSKECYMAKGLTFRHMLYPSYKSNRNPTPDTVVQSLQYFKASIKAMSIKVVEVPGVEADDVVGTLAVNSVSTGYKVRVVSPDKDFFQIISPSLRILRIAPRGPGLLMLLLLLVTRVEGIGDVNALKLITKFGSLENLLLCVDQVDDERIRKALIACADQAVLCKNLVHWRICYCVLIKLMMSALIACADQAVLCKNLATLRSDLPSYMVPFKTPDLVFRKPQDNGDKFITLLRALGAYAEGFSPDPIIRRAAYLWNKLKT
ncbi:hypothetical protein C4D60_Mb01t05760 [Musa balbisiana]|uniref:5'-3' exonuclease domain-containing protein n=1 Tax=Musa balbisiana TaxID=52838 RepID=A0A4V6T4G6_MUSBA|nr:hypothetical protein C4D60_Mb01t05760 [Musa balbisiana]